MAPARGALLALLCAAVAARAGEPERAVLASHGLGPEPASLAGYLRSLRPGERERAVAAEAVRRLRSESPAERQEALQRLGALTAPPLAELREAAASDDPDVRRAAARLLEEAIVRIRRDVLLAVLRTIAEERIEGLAEDVLGAVPVASEARLVPTSLAAALRATLRPEDVPLLRAAAAEGDIETRALAVRALGAARGAGPADAARYLDSAEERIRLAAALALADAGERRCLPVLFALLDGEAAPVRRGAADGIRATCGGGVGFDPLGAPETRRAAAEAWRKWFEARPADDAWTHPLPLAPCLLGRTLVTIYNEGRVIEFDAEGRRTFEVSGLESPWALQGLPDGRRLVALYQLATIVEYDAEGKEVGRLKMPGGWLTGFQRLENGHTVVALMNPDRIVELRPDGSVASEVNVPGPPVNVRVLDNDRFLVCIANRPQVIELDRTGRVRWSLAGLSYVANAQRLENGNTLVADSHKGRAVEYDPSGRVVWERQGLAQCFSAERLEDGSTLVADQTGVREIAPDGKERWILKTGSFARAFRY
jgi:hypothetical protein